LIIITNEKNCGNAVAYIRILTYTKINQHTDYSLSMIYWENCVYKIITLVRPLEEFHMLSFSLSHTLNLSW